MTRKALFDKLPAELAADIVEELDTEEQTELVIRDGCGESIRHHRRDGIRRCHRPCSLSLMKNRQRTYSATSDKEEAQEFKELLSYEDDSSGGIMGTEFIALSPSYEGGKRPGLH
ncbi:MAG: hypothetical protein MZV65_17025 [Chromatiales bacterium]|nr:hypothetical protein [Chromatiales bacterium]